MAADAAVVTQAAAAAAGAATSGSTKGVRAEAGTNAGEWA